MADLPKSVKAANEYREELLGRDEAAMIDMARRWLNVENAIRPNLERLIAEIQAATEAGTEISRVTLLQLNRYQILTGQLTAEISRFNLYASGVIDELQEGAVQFAGVTAADLILSTASDVGAVGITFDRLSIEATENIAALSRAGQPLRTLLELNYPTAVNAITDRLIAGVALGINPRDIARDIMKNQLSQSYRHTVLVARDQHLRAYRTATQQAYQSSGVVTRYKRLAAKNNRTCLACLALDGEIFDLGELMPLHPQDRCTMLPILAQFQPVNFQTGEAWFKRQPAAYQRKALGPGRYELWKNGGFGFKQLVTVRPNETWGPGAAVTSLRDLKQGLGGLAGRPIQPRLPIN